MSITFERLRAASLLTASAATLVLAACSGPLPAPVRVSDEAGNEHFRLTIASPSGVYAANEPIAVEATLTYVGAAPGFTAIGPGGGIVNFGLDQVDGPLDMGPAVTADCAPHEFRRGELATIPFQKSGGYSDDDPEAAFWKGYFAEQALRLPAGTWRITAELDYVEPECGGDSHHLDAAVEIVVR